MSVGETTRRARGPVTAYLAATGLSLFGNALIGVILPWIVLQRHGAATAALVGQGGRGRRFR